MAILENVLGILRRLTGRPWQGLSTDAPLGSVTYVASTRWRSTFACTGMKVCNGPCGAMAIAIREFWAVKPSDAKRPT